MPELKSCRNENNKSVNEKEGIGNRMGNTARQKLCEVSLDMDAREDLPKFGVRMYR